MILLALRQCRIQLVKDYYYKLVFYFWFICTVNSNSNSNIKFCSFGFGFLTTNNYNNLQHPLIH